MTHYDLITLKPGDVIEDTLRSASSKRLCSLVLDAKRATNLRAIWRLSFANSLLSRIFQY